MVEAQFYSPGVGLGLYPKVNVLNVMCEIFNTVELRLPIIEGNHERTKRLDIFLFSTHHSMVFRFHIFVTSRHRWQGRSVFSESLSE